MGTAARAIGEPEAYSFQNPKFFFDDEPSVHLMLGLVLRKAGYFVSDPRDSEEALREFNESPCDIVITDRVMPKMDGEELAAELRMTSILEDVRNRAIAS